MTEAIGQTFQFLAAESVTPEPPLDRDATGDATSCETNCPGPPLEDMRRKPSGPWIQIERLRRQMTHIVTELPCQESAEIALRRQLRLMLCCDHRVFNGPAEAPQKHPPSFELPPRARDVLQQTIRLTRADTPTEAPVLRICSCLVHGPIP